MTDEEALEWIEFEGTPLPTHAIEPADDPDPPGSVALSSDELEGTPDLSGPATDPDDD